MTAPFFLRAAITRQPIVVRSVAIYHISCRQTSNHTLYGIAALSNRNETQYFKRLSNLPFVQHSTPLELIQTSEAHAATFLTSPTDSPQVHRLGLGKRGQKSQRSVAAEAQNDWAEREVREIRDDRALGVGRAALAGYRSEIRGLKKRTSKHMRALKEGQEIRRALVSDLANARQQIEELSSQHDQDEEKLKDIARRLKHAATKLEVEKWRTDNPYLRWCLYGLIGSFAVLIVGAVVDEEAFIPAKDGTAIEGTKASETPLTTGSPPDAIDAVSSGSILVEDNPSTKEVRLGSPAWRRFFWKC